MAGRPNPEVQGARAKLIADKDNVLDRYHDGESLNSLRHAYGVGGTWLAAQFDRWGVARRDRSAAGRMRGSVDAPKPMPRR